MVCWINTPVDENNDQSMNPRIGQIAAQGTIDPFDVVADNFLGASFPEDLPSINGNGDGNVETLFDEDPT